jgi:hypothetical protein
MDRRHPFDPQSKRINDQASRTQRAYRESMQVSLAHAGGHYTVYAASGTTYDVDIVAETCTCPDYRANEPEGGCKHLRRVDLEIQAKRVPTPDGRLPARPAADGSHDFATSTDELPAGRIRGPIAELDANKAQTGAEYYRCRACGTEAMRQHDLSSCCDSTTR